MERESSGDSKILKKYSWEEVKAHNCASDCWVVLEREVDGVKKGLVLDITEWAPRHPGGDILYDGAGGDVTIMFWSYHPLSLIDNSSSYVNKMVIGEVEDYKCIYEVGTAFHRTLKRRVEDKITASERRSDWRIIFKALMLLLVSAITFWAGWIHGNIIAVIILGYTLSSIGLNVAHDGVHSAFSKSRIICKLAAFSFNLLGNNYLAYRKAHAFGHHAYTNHLEYDTGITGSFPVLRLHPKLEHSWFHKFQYIYVVPIYLFSILLFWFGDTDDMYTLYNFPKRQARVTLSDWLVAISGRMVFFSWYIGLHFWMFPWQKALLDCTIVCVEIGFLALVFFVVNHWTEKAALITNKELVTKTADWAMLQILVSSNFSVKSPFWFHVSGGLNLQIEHHLFPGIVHTRLPDIVPIVRKTCKEYGINYDAQCYDSFWDAFGSNHQFIKNLGNNIANNYFPNFGKTTLKHA